MRDTLELALRFEPESIEGTTRCTISLSQGSDVLSVASVAFESPLDKAVLSDLRWYLEVFPDWPAEQDIRRAARIEAEFLSWGQALLSSVQLSGDASDAKASAIWKRFAAERQSQARLVIESHEPGIARIPWELLADHSGFLFSQGISIQRRLEESIPVEWDPAPLPLRILQLTCRPDDAPYSDPRIVSDALLSALGGLEQKVVIEFLYPPTFESLRERLGDKERPVHAVHFDGHCEGAFRQGFLLFEDSAHQTDSIDAGSMGSLLVESDVPLFLLFASPGTTREESSPGSTVSMGLVNAGVPSVISMSFGMLPTATMGFAQGFYGGLSGGLSVAQAVDNGRRALFPGALTPHLISEDGAAVRQEHGTQLREWFLPALYQGSSDPIIAAGAAATLSSDSSIFPAPLVMVEPSFPGRLPSPPLYGFRGRSRELQRLVRTFATRDVVVLSGYAGSGKTALAAETGRWLFRLGRIPGGVVYISFDRGGSLNLLCLRVGQAATNDPEFVLETGNGTDPVEQISALLQNRPMLIILDHFEAVTQGGQLAPQGELDALIEAVWSWCQPSGFPGTKVLIATSDSTLDLYPLIPQDYLAGITLQGLTRADALELAAAILDKHGIDRSTIDSSTLANLAEHVGGQPASLYLVLPLLRFWVPARLSASLERLLPGFTTGAARSPAASLKVTLDFYLRRLGDDVLQDMPALAVFRDGAMEAEILWITRLDPELWQVVRASLAEASLVTLEALPGIGPPFLRFHSALAAYLEDRLEPERRSRLQEAHWRRYYALAKHLLAQDTRHPRQTRAIALREMPNMYRAAEILASSGRIEKALEMAKFMTPFLTLFGRDRECRALISQLESLRKRLVPAAGTGDLPPWTESLVATVVQAVKGGDNAADAATEFFSNLDMVEKSGAVQVDRGVARDVEPSAGLELFGEQVARDISARLAAISPEFDPDDPMADSDIEEEPPFFTQEGTAADAVIAAHIREEWELVIGTVVAACNGDQSAAADLPPLLEQMSQDDDWRGLAQAINSIMEGERSPETMTGELDSIDAIIVNDILQMLNAA